MLCQFMFFLRWLKIILTRSQLTDLIFGLIRIFISLVLFIFAEKIKNQWLRNLFIAGDIFLIILVGFSRIYLKVHWFSDALAGFALGLFWLTFLILVFRIIVSLIKRN